METWIITFYVAAIVFALMFSACAILMFATVVAETKKVKGKHEASR